jgi:hypothetical protein
MHRSILLLSLSCLVVLCLLGRWVTRLRNPVFKPQTVDRSLQLKSAGSEEQTSASAPGKTIPGPTAEKA